MDPVGAVAIRQVKSTVRQKCIVGWHKRVAAPAFRRVGVLAFGVNPGIHWRSLFPNLLTLERELGKILQLLISGHIKELFVALGANFQSMAPSLELVAKRPDE